MKVFESRLGDTHPKVASTHTTLGSTYFEEGRKLRKNRIRAKSKQSYEKAVFHYRKAIDISGDRRKEKFLQVGGQLEQLGRNPAPVGAARREPRQL